MGHCRNGTSCGSRPDGMGACSCGCVGCEDAREARFSVTIPMRRPPVPVAVMRATRPDRGGAAPSVTLAGIVEEYLAALGLDPTERAVRAEAWLRMTRNSLGAECPSCRVVGAHKIRPQKAIAPAPGLVYECEGCRMIWFSHRS